MAAFLLSEGDQDLDISDLYRHCREHMSPQKTPTVWCQVQEFPLTGSGKVQKFMLRDKFLAGDYATLEPQ